MKTCPCCGGDMPNGKRHPLDLVAEIGVSPRSMLPSHKLFYRLASSFGRTVSHEEIFDACYGDDPNGGPDHGTKSICVQICKWRHKLASVGLKVVSDFGVGYRMVWLERQEAA